MGIDLNIEIELCICDADEDRCGDNAIDKAARDRSLCEAGGEHRGVEERWKPVSSVWAAQLNDIGSLFSLPIY